MQFDSLSPVTRSRVVLRRTWLTSLLLLPLLAGGCSDSTGSDVDSEQVVVVLNSVGISLTVVPVGGSTVRQVGLGADGTPTTLAVRDSLAVVPMGVTDVVRVVNLRTGATVWTVPLPSGSGSTGVAFASDSIAIVANPDRNTVSPVNVRRGTAGPEIAVGVYPQALVADDDRVYVVNGNLVNFSPAGPGSRTS